jgi:cytochrome c oxidase cbb3-type subunit 3
MSDFTSGFWNFYVAGVVLIGIIGCAVFLWSHGSATFTIGKTTGHAWDEDLEEYNNPLPKWWSWMFYITVVFALGYLVWFPGLGSFKGMGGWCSQDYDNPTCKNSEYGAEVKKAEDLYAPIYQRFSQMDIPAIAADREAMEMGRRLFMTYCVQCHGAKGEGSRGFPNLTDGDWLYGGAPEQIEETIKIGRNGVMTPHDYLETTVGPNTIKDLANYVRSLSGLDHDSASANRGRAAYARDDVDCKTCHGIDLRGSLALGEDFRGLGAPNLTDDTWLYGSSEDTIVDTITKGRINRMPAWGNFLGKDKVHLLAAYVYGLSNK